MTAKILNNQFKLHMKASFTVADVHTNNLDHFSKNIQTEYGEIGLSIDIAPNNYKSITIFFGHSGSKSKDMPNFTEGMYQFEVDEVLLADSLILFISIINQIVERGTSPNIKENIINTIVNHGFKLAYNESRHQTES